MKIRQLSFAILLLAGCASSLPEKAPFSLDLSALSAESPASCRFEKEQMGDGHGAKHSDWYFLRLGNRTETRDEASQQGEIWERDDAGRLFFTRLFHSERVALDYSPSDLAASQGKISWDAVWSIIDPNQLGKALRLTGREHRDGVWVEHYASQAGDAATEIDWIPLLKLPSRIIKTSDTGTVTLQLAECRPSATAAIQPISPEALADYRHLEYTDLGDMESNPLVQRILFLSGEDHHH